MIKKKYSFVLKLYVTLMFLAALYGALNNNDFSHGLALGALVVASLAFGVSLANEATK